MSWVAIISIILVVVLLVVAFVFLRVLLKIIKLVSILLLVAGLIFVGFTYFELTSFQKELSGDKVYYALSQEGQIIAGLESNKGVFSVAAEKKIKDRMFTKDRVLAFDSQIFSDIDQEEYSDRSIAFATALETKLKEEGGLFIVENYVDESLEINPSLVSLDVLTHTPLGKGGLFFSPILEQFRTWRYIIS